MQTPSLARYDVVQTFGPVAKDLGDDKKSVVGYTPDPHSHSHRIPSPNRSYVFRRNLLADVLLWHRMNTGEGLYLSGPTGAGKSSVIKEICARIRMPLLTAIGHNMMEAPELIGGLGVKDGATFFREGPLTIALRNGFWFLLDEVDLLNPGTATALNLVLDGNGLTIAETGEFIPAHREFRIIVTGNTLGDGMTEHYIGTQKMNLAFLDRFFKVKVDYPTKDEEMQLLAQFSNLAPAVQSLMVDFATRVRASFVNGESNVTLSTRTLVKWAGYATAVTPLLSTQAISIGTEENATVSSELAYNPQYYSLQRVLLNQANEQTVVALTSIFSSLFS